MVQALPIAYLNGRFLPIEEARISPLDRGFLFADAVYEVIAVYDGRPLLIDAHLARLSRSLSELRIPNPHGDAAWRDLIAKLIERNRAAGTGADMGVYVHVSRGADRGREQVLPAGLAPTVFAMASPLTPADLETPGVSAITGPDTRWARCDIKSTALLANVLLRETARQAGAGEYIMLRDGYVTEGSGSSVVIVEGDTLISRADSTAILPGTTLRLVREVAAAAGFGYREEAIGEQRLRNADEIWLTASMRGVAPVTRLDGAPVGTGVPGPVWRVVAQAYEIRKRN